MKPTLLLKWLAVILVGESLALANIAFGDQLWTIFVILFIQLFAGVFLFGVVPNPGPNSKSYQYWFACVVLVAWLASSFAPARWEVYSTLRFNFIEPQLLRALSEAQKAPDKEGTIGRCDFEKTDALRIYCTEGGILDDHYGYLYDATGKVLTLDGTVERWFGGRLIRARSIGGDWYVVSFT